MSIIEDWIGLEISDRTKSIITWISRIGLLVLLVGTFMYARDVERSRYEICLNPNEYCPFEYHTFDEQPDVDWGLLSEHMDLAEINETEIEKNVYRCLAYAIQEGC